MAAICKTQVNTEHIHLAGLEPPLTITSGTTYLLRSLQRSTAKGKLRPWSSNTNLRDLPTPAESLGLRSTVDQLLIASSDHDAHFVVIPPSAATPQTSPLTMTSKRLAAGSHHLTLISTAPRSTCCNAPPMRPAVHLAPELKTHSSTSWVVITPHHDSRSRSPHPHVQSRLQSSHVVRCLRNLRHIRSVDQRLDGAQSSDPNRPHWLAASTTSTSLAGLQQVPHHILLPGDSARTSRRGVCILCLLLRLLRLRKTGLTSGVSTRTDHQRLNAQGHTAPQRASKARNP
jgi:hypothetical protein